MVSDLNGTVSDPPVALSSVAPTWLDELDLDVGPPINRLGLRSLPHDRWLVVDEHRDAELALKADLLDRLHEQVFAALPGTEAASAELSDLVIGHMADVHEIARVEPDPSLHPLDAIGRLVQEDLILMSPGPDGYTLTAASLCFPSGWRLGEKMGLPMRAIHEPVSRYESELGSKADRFFERLAEGRMVWRRNWFLHNDPRLFAPRRERPGPEITAANVGTDMALRTERQTLRRLTTGDLVFTVRTEQVALAALRARPDIAEQMSVYLRDSPTDAVAGKGALDHVHVVLPELATYASR